MGPKGPNYYCKWTQEVGFASSQSSLWDQRLSAFAASFRFVKAILLLMQAIEGDSCLSLQLLKWELVRAASTLGFEKEARLMCARTQRHGKVHAQS